MRPTTLYTVGYEKRTLDALVCDLQRVGVRTLVDVRELPLSRRTGFSKTRLSEESAVVRWPESVPTIDCGRFNLIADFTRRVDRRARVQLASDLDRIPGLNGALVSGRQAAARVIAAVPAATRPATVTP